jgi:hypothetical protein
MNTENKQLLNPSDNLFDEDTKQIGNLTKPNAPLNNNPENQMINNQIVEKIWRAILRHKLYQSYTQEQLDNLVINACKCDCHSIQKNFNIDTLEMTIDLLIMPLQQYRMSHR